MKTRVAFLTCFLVLVSCFSLYAKPEVMELKSAEMKAREGRAEALARKIDLAKVEDPDTRLALEAILRMLGLEEEAGIKKPPASKPVLGKAGSSKSSRSGVR